MLLLGGCTPLAKDFIDLAESPKKEDQKWDVEKIYEKMEQKVENSTNGYHR